MFILHPLGIVKCREYYLIPALTTDVCDGSPSIVSPHHHCRRRHSICGRNESHFRQWSFLVTSLGGVTAKLLVKLAAPELLLRCCGGSCRLTLS
jgi:hypothetical protein